MLYDQDMTGIADAQQQIIDEQVRAIHLAADTLIQVGKHLSNREKSPKVRVEIEPESTHKAFWEKYSEGVKSTTPAQKTFAVAQRAMKQGHSPATVCQILSHDPEFQSIKSQEKDPNLGQEKAERYAKLAVNAVCRKELVAVGSQQRQKQQQVQQVQSSELER